MSDTLKDRVLAYIEANDYVSYAELAHRFPEFKGGDFALYLRENLIIWANMTQEATQAIAGRLLDAAKTGRMPGETVQ